MTEDQHKREIENGIKRILGYKDPVYPSYADSRYQWYFYWNNDKYGTTLHVSIGQMYEAVPCAFAELKAISELCGTDNIRLSNDYEPGCESCDWGSKATLDIYIDEIRV